MWRQDRPSWTHADELAALNVEITDFWGRFHARMWGVKPGDLPPAPQITHPDRHAPPGREPTTDPAEIRQWFAQHMRRR